MGYFFLDHPADVMVRLEGIDEKELLKQAGLAVCEYLVGTIDIPENETRELRGNHLDREELIVSVLNDLIFEAAVNAVVLPKLKILKIHDRSYSITAGGAKVDGKKIVWKGEIKAATFGGLDVKTLPDTTLQADIILDT